MRFDLTVSQFVFEMATRGQLLVYDADTWRPYCHILDISRAIVAVLGADSRVVSNQVFNVGDTGQQFTKRMIVNEIQNYLPDAQVEYRSGDTDPRNYRVSFEKIADRLGFRTRFSVETYVPRLLEAISNGVFPYDVRSPRYGNYSVVDSYGLLEHADAESLIQT
jgi:nucleoside-diphosphate-sugar epimerase